MPQYDGPERRARLRIDAGLKAAGWAVQDRDGINLTTGRGVAKEFANYRTPDDNRRFTELYNVQRLTTNTIGASTKVAITTIQRLYSMLKGEPDLPRSWRKPPSSSGRRGSPRSRCPWSTTRTFRRSTST